MSGGGKQGSSTTVQNAEPWSGIQPFLTDLYGRAQGQSNLPQSYFPGSTVVGFSPETEAGLGYMTERAVQGSPLLGQAQDTLGRTLAGDFLTDENPYFGAVADRIYRQVRPRVDAQFARGPLGSPGHEFTMASALADSMAPLAYGDYARERGFQNAAIGQAAPLAREDYFDAQQLMGAGQAREALQSRILQDEINRFNFGQGEPWNRLGMYAGLLQNPGGGQTSTTTTGTQPGGNLALGLLGGGLSLAGMLGAPGFFGPASILGGLFD